MAGNKLFKKSFQLLKSFSFGFLFIFLVFILLGGILIININQQQKVSKEYKINYQINIPLSSYNGSNFSLEYPENYQLFENKIMATEGIIDEQENTIHLISPPLNKNQENLSMIITFKPYNQYLRDDVESTTCPALYKKKLVPIKIGNLTFTQSGKIFCGPSEVAFLYLLRNNTIYEIKAETSASYDEVLPEIKRILATMKFKQDE